MKTSSSQVSQAVADTGAAIRERPLGIRSVRSHRALWWVGGLVVLAMAVTQVYDVMRRHQIVVETAEHEFTSLARALTEHSYAAFQATDVVIRGIASERRIADILDRERYAVLKDRIANLPQVDSIAIGSADGSTVVSSDNRLIADITEQPYFRVHRSSAVTGLYVSRPFQAPGRASRTVALSRAIDDRGVFAGVVVAFLDLSYFERFYASLHVQGGREFALVGRDGVLLAGYAIDHTAPGNALPGLPLYQAPLTRQDGVTTVLRAVVAGREMIHAVQSVPGFPLAIVVRANESAVLAPWRIQAMHSAVRTSLLCASVVLLMWLVYRQLSKRERAEDDLRVQSAHLDELFESAPEAIVMLDLRERVTRVNREFTRIFKYSAAESLGRSLTELIVPVDRRSEAGAAAQTVSRGERTSIDTECNDKLGNRLHVSMLRAPIATSKGPIASFAIYRDITEMKLAETERARLEARLRQAEQLQVIGTMAGGIAHDFSNILAAMVGYLEMCLAAVPESGPAQRHIGSVMKAANRAQELIDQILTYSRTTQGKSRAINVSALVDEALDLLRASVPGNIDLAIHAAQAKGMTVLADPTHIHQLVMNLCTNAVHAMTDGGTLTVSLERSDIDEHRSLSHGSLSAGRYVRLVVDDTGCGMDAQTRQRIFEPFFTTRATGSGTGLGLAVVHGIVTELGGAIDVQSKLGRGSRFAVFLPRADVPAIPAVEGIDSFRRGQGQRVLLVDDEKALVLLTEEMLAALCYEPAGFIRGEEALQEYRNDPQRFDVALLDQLMPGLTGIELARRLRETRPHLPVILMSGYVGPLLEQEATAAGIHRILTKPLKPIALSEAMAEALTGVAGPGDQSKR